MMNRQGKKNSDKRVALFIPSMHGGGAERVFLNLAESLVTEGFCVDLVLAQAEGTYLEQLPNEVNVVDLAASRVLFAVAKLKKYLKQTKPDVALGAMGHANLILLWANRLAGSPSRIAVSEHNTLSKTSSNVQGFRERFLPWFEKTFYPWADAIIAVSSGVADDLAKVTGISRQKIQVIFNPVVTEELHQKARMEPSHPWLIDRDAPVLLALGRLTEQKGFDILLPAFAKLRQQREAKLLICGEGPQREELEAMVESLDLQDDVDLAGFVENPYALLSSADLFVLSSRWEGLPTVLIEAIACGCPVVSTDCPSGPDEILEQGKHGMIVPVEDVDTLAEAMSAALDDHPSKEQLQQRAEVFTQESVLGEYLKVLFDTDGGESSR